MGSTEPSTRLLTANDFGQWLSLYVPYLTEIGIGTTSSHTERQARFSADVARSIHWGVEEEGKLSAIGSFNALSDGIAQIGGVYTTPERRRQGLAKLMMKRIIHDAYSIHGLHELILFTGEDDIGPRNLYESLGFVEQDRYSMVEYEIESDHSKT